MIDKRSITAQVHMYLLRPFRIEQKGNAIHLPTRKTESLLAYLVLHPGYHSREKLATLFWADSSDVSARGSLRKALNLIRKHVGNEIILADREYIQLSPDHDLYCDALEFARQASQFLAAQNPDIHQMDFELYQNELLIDFYEDWVLDEREHYHQLYIKVLLRAIEGLRAQSEYDITIQYAKQLLIHESTNEQAYQHLIFCHIALGDRHGAVQQYEACRRVLETELGVKPARETQALYEWITQASELRSLAARLTNLPIPISSFIGRGRELAEIKRLLSIARLITLTGVGGSGKTRLAIRVATELLDSFQDGVWWVDFSSLSNAELVPQSVAKCLGVIESSEQAPIESIIAAIQEKEMLLVLDNCEHLVEACAHLVNSLLTQCPHLKVLTTSREALQVDGEMVYNVPTLSIPQIDKLSIADLLLEYESVKLFAVRARAIQDNFVLDDHTALLVAEVCARLDGIPLAIELAAARVKTMSVEQITANLDDAFRLLIGGSRVALPRQQTLRAMIDWSYDLLSEQEKILFRRLAVFIGGWSLEAAEVVCSGDGIEKEQIFDCLSQLVNKSVISAENIRGETRFHMLETIRQYAREKLLESAETEMMRDRHLDFYMALAEDIQPRLRTAERIARKKQLEVEHHNSRAALEWSLVENNKVEKGARMACALEPFWKYLGYYREGRSWLEQCKALLTVGGFSDSSLYAKTLYLAGHLACFQEDHASARPLLEESVALYKRIEPLDVRGLAEALEMLAWIVQFEDLALAYHLSVEAETLCQKLGAEGIQDLARALFWCGHFAYEKRDFNAARSYAEKSRTLWQQTENVWQSAAPVGLLGILAFHHRDYTTARFCYEESLRLFREVEDNVAIASFTSRLGDVYHILGSYAEAGRCYQEGLTLWQSMGIEHQVGLDLRDLGIVEMHQGNFERARKLLKESLPLLKLHSADPEKDISIALNLIGLSEIARNQNQRSRASRLLGVAEAIVAASKIGSAIVWFDSANYALGFFSLDEYEQLVAAGHKQLDETAWLEGQTMKIDQVIEYALEDE